MQIVLVTANYQPANLPCGVGDYTRCLRRALEALGQQCAVVTSSRSWSQEKDVYRLPGHWGPRDVIAAWRILRQARPDVVLLQYTPEHYGYGFAFKLLPFLVRARAPGARFITTFHTLVGGRRRAKVSAALLAAGSHGVIGTHEELADLFRRRLSWWAGKLREIPIGPNLEPSDLSRPEARRRLCSRLQLDASVSLVGCFGFPAGRKGMDVLLHSAARSLDPFHLAMVTATREEDRPVRRKLETLSEDLGIAKRVHWLDGLSHQEAARALAGCDLYAVPYDDGVSLRRGTLMAGWQQGLAVVSTTPRFPSPFFTDGETLLLAPPRNPVALAVAIERVLQDPDLRRRLEAAASRVAARFSWEGIATAHMDFARDIGAREAA